MQDSPSPNRPAGARPADRHGAAQYSFTSFQPLSPDESKGSFFFSKIFQWKKSESVPGNGADRPTSLVVPGRKPAVRRQAGVRLRGRGESWASRGIEPRQKQSQHLKYSSNVRNKASNPQIPKSWSSPIFPQRQALSSTHSAGLGPGHSKQLPPSYRNLSALFKRLSAVADYSKAGQLSQPYKESDFKQYWMPDEHCKECYECGEKFNTFRRRHHCRLCGQIFCYRCCNVEVPGQLMGYTGGLRVCTYCYKVVQTYTQSPDLIRNLEQLQADLRAVTLDSDLNISTTTSANNLTVPRAGGCGPFDEDADTFFQQSIARKTSTGSMASNVYFEKMEQSRPTSSMLGTVRSPFDAFGVCTAEADMLKQDSLRELWHQIMSPRTGIELLSHRFRLKTYQNCLVASDLVDWLMTYEKSSTRTQAVNFGQELVESGWLERVPQTREIPVFKDEYALYQPGPVAVKDLAGNPRSSIFFIDYDSEERKDLSDENNEDDEDDETLPQWFRQLSGYESCEELDQVTRPQSAVTDSEAVGNVIPKAAKFSSAKLLDLDITAGTTCINEEDSELSLKVNLDHFGEGTGVEGKDTSTVSIITDVPPPPLEQYVYTEGYPASTLRSSNKKSAEPQAVLSTSADEVLHGAMMAKKMGVTRPGSPEPVVLRDDNDERLVMEMLHKAHAYHISSLLEQLLLDAGLSLEWKETILPLVDMISEKVSPDVRNDDDMDIRQYVKFKKIPGGSRADCHLVSGVVFSKNISNKKMANMFNNPKILVLCCAIDYQRNENRLASLDPLVLQEYEFLKNFVARVAALRPNVLLVEKTVSRLAQDMLLQYGITLALNVKPEVIKRVARCTKADTLRSMEQLSRPQLGTCQLFRVQKFLLKNGEPKTLMFFEGCPTELGCTVTLRGGNSFVLTKVKKIIQYVTYVAYSQKLEMSFLMDEFALPLQLDYLSYRDPKNGDSKDLIKTARRAEAGDQAQTRYEDSANQRRQHETELKDGHKDSGDTHEQSHLEDNAKMFQLALDRTILSSSFLVKYPLPYLLSPEGAKCAVRSALPKEIYWSVKLQPGNQTKQFNEDELTEFDLPMPSQRKASKVVEIIPPHVLTSANFVVDSRELFVQGVISDFRSQGGRIQLKCQNGSSVKRRKSKWLELDGISKAAIAVDATDGKKEEMPLRMAVAAAKLQSSSNKQCSPASPIHFSCKIDCLDPQHHQRIAVLFSSYSSESNNSPRPCISPWAVFMEFYGRNDITLGGFLERYCFRPSYVCPNPNCDVSMVDHVRYFAHGTGSVYIHMKNLESPIPGFQHTILSWSWCKECKQVTPIVPLSNNAWALSFAKYLELRFYADSYTRRASIDPCGHSIHREHYQYFAFTNMVASFKYRPIKLFETAIPPAVIWIKDERREASYWLHDVRAMATRGDTVFASIVDRLESLKVEKVGEIQHPDRDVKLLQFAVHLKEEKSKFLEEVQAVEKKVAGLQGPETPPADEHEDSSQQLDKQEKQALEFVIADSLNGLKRILCEFVESWNNRLQEIIQAEKKRTSKPSPDQKRDGKPFDRRFSVDTNRTVKSNEAQASPSEDLSSQAVFRSPGVSPPPSPWGSRTASPFGFQANTIRTSSDSPNSPETAGQSVTDSIKRDLYFKPISAADGPGEQCNTASSPMSSKEKKNTEAEGEEHKGDSSQIVRSGAIETRDRRKTLDEIGSSFVVVNMDYKYGNQQSIADQPATVKPEVTSSQIAACLGNKQTFGKRETFVRGHRRVLSSPPLTTIPASPSSPDRKAVNKEAGMSKVTGSTSIERSRSDTDVNTLTKVGAEKSDILSTQSSKSCPKVSHETGMSNEGLDSDVTRSHEAPDRQRFSESGTVAAARKPRLGKGHVRSMSWTAKQRQATARKALAVDVGEQEGAAAADGVPGVRRRDKMKNIISSFLPGSAFQPVVSTFPSHEHHLLPPGEKVLVVVSEKEPSSIIAYALSMKEYNEHLCEIQRTLTRILSGSGKASREQQQLFYQQPHQAAERESSDEPSRSSLSRSLSNGLTMDDVIVVDEPGSDFVTVDMKEVNGPSTPDLEPDVTKSSHVEFIQSSQEIIPSLDRRRLSRDRERLDKVKFIKDGPAEVNEGRNGDGKDDTDGRKRDENPTQEDPSLVVFGFQPKDADKDFSHIKMQFSYSGCRFVCSAYFAEQFRNLRRQIFLEGEERYIRSLAHCVVWRARGGKSGSTFSKSLDDRFVLKQMSRLELQSFIEFAPHYFQYMSKTLNEKRPPLLAKILGVYRIGYKNSQTNATMRQDVLVMENLFYDRKIDKIFDLKGSMRSRYVQASGTENDVLMDENLLEMIRENPIFIRPHSKAVLSKAIHNDTEFLAQQMVMDYSLLVGIDESRSELVIGIIDFIRTFTWDKKLEMYVKSSGILGGQGKMPTVVSPELYRTRFTEAMQRYFLMVPDKWTGLGNDLD